MPAIKRQEKIVQENAMRHKRDARFRSLCDEGQDRFASACTPALRASWVIDRCWERTITAAH
jgi:hypothetical protein